MCLLAEGPLDKHELPRALGDARVDVVAALRELSGIGLVSLSHSHGTRYLPVSPETSLERLTSRRQAELQQAKLSIAEAYTAFRQSVHDARSEHLIEVVDPPTIQERLVAFERGARCEVRRLDSPPYAKQANANPIEEQQLRQGIRYRSVYSQASLEIPGYLNDNVAPCVAAGEDARVLAEVPIKLTIIDRSVALASLVIGETEEYRSLLVIRPSSLLTGMEGLFELAWRAAVPLGLSGNASPTRLRPDESKMLALLAAGTTDQVIARELGMSRRTLCRRLEQLMSRAGATSRFQLALYARAHDWV